MLDDGQHAVVAPLIRRAAKFGPYWWLEQAAWAVSYATVYAVTDSLWVAIPFGLLAGWVMDGKPADIERVIGLWLDEVGKQEEGGL